MLDVLFNPLSPGIFKLWTGYFYLETNKAALKLNKNENN